MQIPDTNHRRTKAGIERIEDAIGVAQRTRSAALMPYFTLGYPDAKTSLEIIEAISSHSDILELGIPFSDPLADGPTIQHSTQISLERGTTVGSCIKMVSSLRKRGIATPVLLMGYLNPILANSSRTRPRQARTDSLYPTCPSTKENNWVNGLGSPGWP
jgi:tryptophan synthase alpha subunit